MKIVLEEKDKDLLKSILENLPQYSYSHLACHGWDYEKMEFDFTEDTEDGKDGQVEHTLTFDKAWAGFQKWLDAEIGGGNNLAGLGDAGNYDKNMVDEIVQYALLGEVVYG